MDRQALQERFGILGDSPALRRVVERVRQVATTDIAVLLEGESGVGKELIAAAIHGLSPRRHKRLVVVNCGAIPEGLIESELFGAEKGAYTGSVERRTGYFEEADGGTIFLDEIGEMPLMAQVRLLRVLETGQFSRVGSATTQKTDARVIAATNKNLGAEVTAGRFREDLYYRLSAVQLQIPPVRERGDDVAVLFDAFLRRFAKQYDAPLLRLSPEAVALLKRYAWPGNVRELRNVAEQTVVLVRENPVPAEAVRPFLRGVTAGAGLAVSRPPAGAADEARERELVYGALLELRADLRDVREMVRRLAGAGPPADGAVVRLADARPAAEPLPTPGGGDLRFAPEPAPPGRAAFAEPEQEVAYEPPDEDDLFENGFYDAAETTFEIEPPTGPARTDLPDTLDEVLAAGLPLPTMEAAENALIREALRRFEGNRRMTADALGISERTLYRKIRDIEEAG
jgi:DNA-binding NtrC family response regulator